MITNSNILQESTETTFICGNESNSLEIYIRPYQSYYLEYPYLLIMINRDKKEIINLDTQFCRLSMYEAKYLGYEDENLVLTSNELNKVIDLLSKNNYENWYKALDLLSLSVEEFDEYNFDTIRSRFPDYKILLDDKYQKDLKDYMKERSIRSKLENTKTYLEFKRIFESDHDSIFQIYRDKNYDAFFVWEDCTYFLINRNTTEVYDKVSYPSQCYLNNKQRDIKLAESLHILDKIYKFKLPTVYNLNEILSILYAVANNIPYEQISIPYITE